MRTIIAGSRSITDQDLVWAAIDSCGFQISEVACGMARGVDELGYWWAKWKGIPIREFYPDWDKLGKRAGVVRNQDMAEYAEALALVWDGASIGSADMLRRAKKRNLLIYERVVNGL